MTTDTYPKLATATARLGEAEVTINGIAKGAGMIAPDMATMLSFVATDAPIAAPVLQAMLAQGRRRRASTPSPSTATPRPATRCCCSPPGARPNAARRAIDDPADPRLAPFRRALNRVLKNLALQVVRDGEGARKQIEIAVTGAKSVALGQAHRAVDRQFAAGQDGGRRRGRQLGPRRHGRRQGRRAGRPRPAVDLVRRHPRRPSTASATRTIPRPRPRDT